VVVLFVYAERSGDELEFWAGLAGLCENETTVVPDLVCLEILDGDVVHETEFDVEGCIEGDESLVSVLPVGWG
jgi:hypothetical protein